MIMRQEEDFKQYGGIRERMFAARSAARAEEWEKGLFSRLAGAKSQDELQRIASELKAKIDQESFATAKRQGWA